LRRTTLIVIFVIAFAGGLLGFLLKSQNAPQGQEASERQIKEDPRIDLTSATFVKNLSALVPKTGNPPSIFSEIKVFKPHLMQPGLNLFANESNKDELAVLTDAAGHIVHRWVRPSSIKKMNPYFVRLDIYGNLLFLDANDSLTKLSWESKVVWHQEGRFHHDIAVLENGDLVIPERREREITFDEQVFPILEDVLAVISASDGSVLKRLSLYDIFKEVIPEYNLRDALVHWQKGLKIKEDTDADLMHLNSVFRLRHSREGFGKKGDILLYLPRISTLAVVDIKKEKLLWHKYHLLPGAQVVHDFSQLTAESVLLFDNGLVVKPTGEVWKDWNRGFSRILEVDPVKLRYKWGFSGNSTFKFFSNYRGRVKQMPNGNFFITSSNERRVVEVTRSGEVVFDASYPGRYDSSEVTRVIGLEDFRPLNPRKKPKWAGYFSDLNEAGGVAWRREYSEIDFDWYYFHPRKKFGFLGKITANQMKARVAASFKTCIARPEGLKEPVTLKVLSSVPVQVSLDLDKIQVQSEDDGSYSFQFDLQKDVSLLNVSLAPFTLERVVLRLELADSLSQHLGLPDGEGRCQSVSNS
jgi:hypothetical protein